MDTSELMELGARALIVKLCKQIDETIAVAPGVRRFAHSMIRESLGMKPLGPKTKEVNGSTADRLASQLVDARKKRGTSGRPPMSDKQRKVMSRLAKKRWATARSLGIKGGKLPSAAQLNGKANDMAAAHETAAPAS